MKKLLSGIICFMLLQILNAQVVVHDHRSKDVVHDDTSKVVVHDNRTHYDMSANLTRPEFEDMNLYRIQLKITTGTAENAGTDSPVYVEMNNKDAEMANTEGRFYLTKGIDNFQPGKTVTYDFLSKNIRQVKDIEFMKFGLKGDDAVCIKRIELFFNSNSSPVFVEEYPGNGQWIDNHNPTLPATFTIQRTQLRGQNWAYTNAQKDTWRPVTMMQKAWIVSMVEGSIGDQIMHGDEILWGSTGGLNTITGDAVEANWVNDHTLHFDLDLQVDVKYAPNPGLDVDFDLDFSCENGTISTKVKNMIAESNVVGDIESWILTKGLQYVGKAIGAFAGGYVAGPKGAVVGKEAGDYLAGKLSEVLAFPMKLDVHNPSISQSCKHISITKDCNMLLQ